MRQGFALVLLAWLLAPETGNAQTPVILISIDTLRGDALGVHSPEILSYATEGTRFTAAQTQIPLTLPSHTTLLTSAYPYQSGVEENAGKVPATLPTLAAVLKANGYKTAAFIGSIFLERQLGLDGGFDVYDSPFNFEAFSRLSGEMLFGGNVGTAYTVRERRPGPLVLKAASQWLAAHKGEPVFLFVHLFDMHKPWRQPSYHLQLESVDKLLGDFRQKLKAEGWWDRSLIVLLSDHGEGLGDHGESDHGYFIYQSTLHVPLLIHWPQGQIRLPARTDQPAGLIDVAPTILDFLKISPPSTFKGKSLLAGGPSSVFAESVYARDSFGWAALRSLREDAWKYIEAPRPELYNLDHDPNELHNLAGARPGLAARLKSQLQSYRPSAMPPRVSESPGRNKEVLESLGYLSPGPRTLRPGPAADPKDRLPELLRYEDALTLLQKKQTTAAVSIFRSILASDPKNVLVARDLGVSLIEQKKFSEAISRLEEVARVAPGDYITLYELGIANESAGRLKEALARLQTASAIAPDAAQANGAIERVKAKLRVARSDVLH